MRKFASLLVVLLTSTAFVFAQNPVQGKVTDSKDGSPLSSVSVKVKGTSNGISTSPDGSFSLDIGSSAATLEITSVGYVSKTLKVTPGQSVSISLDKEAAVLTEVVLTGVGTATSKRKVAFDVGSISSKDVAKSATGSVEQALQGKIAGSQIQFLSGTPGSSPIIILRALNTLSYSPPLIMVDGIQVASLDEIDLGSVDRVEVVKGAAGGMLYGANGGNGVIQVFTKKGSRNKKLEINVLSQASFGNVIADKNIIAKNHSFQTDAQGYLTKGGVRIQPDATGLWPDADLLDPNNPGDGGAFVMNNHPYKEQTYDHIKQAYSTASTYNNSVSMTGGGDKSDYAFTLSNYNEKNVLENSYEKTSITANTGFELAKGLTFRNIVQTIFLNENLLSGDADASIGGTSSNRFGIANAWPYIDFKHRDSTGHLVVFPRNDAADFNPLSEGEWRSRGSVNTRIIENANLHYNFPKFLELDYKYGIDFQQSDDHNFYYNQTTSLQASIAHWGNTVDGSIENTFTSDKLQNSLLTAIFKTDFEKDFHSQLPITTVTQVAYDYRREDFSQYFAEGVGMPTYPPYNISVAGTLTAGDFYSHFVTFGTVFSQSIDYKDLIGISGGVRSDYSSVYGAGHSAFTFPRGSIYFRPTSLTSMGALSDWKLRATYAEAGIQPNPYSNQTTLAVATLGTVSTISNASSLSNPGLQVQLSKELEVGTDLTFKTNLKNWFNKITINFSYWDRKGSQILENEDLPASTGFTQKVDNLVDLHSNGFDLSLDADVLTSKDVDWKFSYRFGTQKAVATKIAGGKDIVEGIFKVQQGKELGLLTLQAPLTSLDETRPDGTAYIDHADIGKYQIVDGVVVDTATKKAQLTDANDLRNVGSALPKFTSSFINSFTIKKNLSISFQVDWVYGNKIYNQTKQWLYRDRLSSDYDKSVTINGVTGPFVAFYNSLYNSLTPLTWFVEDGSFARLRDVSITYNLSNALHLKWAKDLSLTVSGRNLVTITKYSGLDPEATTTADSQGNEARGTQFNPKYAAAIYGADYFAVPNLRSYQVSLRVGF